MLKLNSRSDEVKKLQSGLNDLSFDCGKPDGVFGKNTHAAVVKFQDSVDLYEDGKVGNDTAEKYNLAVKPEFRITLTVTQTPIQTGTKLKLVSVRCDKHKDGFSSMDMREDVAKPFIVIRKRINNLGGIVTSAGCGRPLSMGGGKAQSPTSFHYAFMAFDLALSSGMTSVNDPFVITDDGDGYWRVWARVTSEEIEVQTLKATIAKTVSGKLIVETAEATGRFVDFTAIAKENGFERIRRRASFTKRKSYSAAEWWHFQYEKDLVVGVSTFGGELLKVYDEARIKREFRGDWNSLKYAKFGDGFD